MGTTINRALSPKQLQRQPTGSEPGKPIPGRLRAQNEYHGRTPIV